MGWDRVERFVKRSLGLQVLLGLFVLALVSGSVAASHPNHDADCLLHPDSAPCQSQTVPEEKPKTVGQAKVVQQAPKVEQPGLLDKVGEFFAGVGKGIGDGASAVSGGVGAAFVGAGALMLALVKPIASLFIAIQPSWIGSNLWAGVAASSTATAIGGAQAGSWYLWKKLLPLGFGLPLFSRIEKDELLENDRRARIFELIRQNPGIHLSDIARQLDYAWGTTLHHLRKLRADRLIMFKEIGHHKSFFVNGSGLSETQMQAMSLIKNGTLSKLASYLEEHPRVSLKELSEALQISPPLAAFHIRKLEKAGLVQKVRDGKSVRLSTTAALPAGFLRGLGATAPAPEVQGAAS
jgi:DNA-binding MarR family transcriptional regulator